MLVVMIILDLFEWFTDMILEKLRKELRNLYYNSMLLVSRKTFLEVLCTLLASFLFINILDVPREKQRLIDPNLI